MGKMRKKSRRPSQAAAAEAAPVGKTSRVDWLTRVLIIGLAGSMGFWALFATLIALHANRMTKYARVDIVDLKEAQDEERMEHRHELEAVLKELRDAENLREQVSQLIEQLVVKEKPPDKFEDVLDRVQKVHHHLTLTSLNQEDLKYTRDLLVSLLRNVPLPKARPSGGGPEVRRVLEVLAASGAIESKDIERHLSEVNAALSAEAEKAKPKPQVVKVVTPAPTVAAKPPVVTPKPPPLGPQPQPYVNKPLNFRVMLPPEWTVKDKQVKNGVMAVSPRKSNFQIDTGYAIISATQLKDPGETLGSYTQADFDRIKEYADHFEALDQGEMELFGGRVKARYIRYAHNKLSKRWESVKIIAIDRNVAYMFGFHALHADYQRDYAENFGRIVASFKLLKSG
jgi:hypothetical protein